MRPVSFAVRDADLVMRWPDREVELDGNFLRANCRCAGCRYQELTENKTAGDPAIFDGVELVAVTPMGYGLQLHFSDGHNRGVYPWQYLRQCAHKNHD